MMKEEDDRHDLATAGNIFFGILSVVVDLTSDNEYKEENVAVDVISTGVNQVGEEVFHSDIEKDLEEVKEFWKHEVLNESVLNPGDTIGGLVYLPFSNSAEFFKVIVPVCELPESHLFTQMQINK